MKMCYRKRKSVVGVLSTLVVLGLLDIDGFVKVVSGIEEAGLEADSVSESFLQLLYQAFGGN